ncbi:hypothetical protein NJF44_10680 [Pseudomonas guariconensis]|uniref:hypothetical protein n=1 Tax=Pseudomonas TaxID=286 RepID=UPI002096C51E|nr:MULTISPECIES: hypothetical protein [Pseudomonas]MCO7640752.1 hypothetical protein [Pseudomonas sp. S 311-6]MCO7515713.1 hypothetical protein [Pseudomonas putida]MCO7566446.1 hypothetical protein [Pseudomonas mosselii]MCO7595058.1 hypothetical protein [Pseudomonas guariconensis]MCO7605694.1 hypothetical protein [Pseudomonas guariconensis]
MGMREELQADLAEAFDDLDGLADAVRPVTGSRIVNGGYDPEIGGTVPASTIHYSGRGVFGSYLVKEIDGSRIQTEDVKLLVLQNELFEEQGGAATEMPATPKIGDQVSGYRVLNVTEDPAQATWTIQLRK